METTILLHLEAALYCWSIMRAKPTVSSCFLSIHTHRTGQRQEWSLLESTGPWRKEMRGYESLLPSLRLCLSEMRAWASGARLLPSHLMEGGPREALSFRDAAGPCVLGSMTQQEMLAAPGSLRTPVLHAVDPSVLFLIWCRHWGQVSWVGFREGLEAGRDVLSFRSRCQASTLPNRAPVASWLCC